MLAGLIFATEDADDRPGTLAATLPFGGLTLIEFQARLLVAEGASQIILVIARLTPELLGAINRIGRRGVSVDAVRTAAEVLEKLHPLSRVLVVADGVMTTGEVMATMAAEIGDALLVTGDQGGNNRFERVGALTAWAGLALLDPKRIVEVAAMPKDYDFQSTLLRVAAQAGAVQIRLPAGAAGGAHGIERDSRQLAERGKAILSALAPVPVPWADRFILAPLARLALPHLIGRGLPSVAVAASAGIAAIGGFAALYFGWPIAGLALAIVAMIGLGIGTMASALRDEAIQLRVQQAAMLTVPALSALLLGRESASGWIAAGAAIVAAALVERAGIPRIRRRWWASPPAYPILMLPFVIFGQPLAALIAAGGYAAVTLGGAIEAFREKP
ncbi:MAG: hypothetical protein JWN66_4894 [Sphingomonas bacterium]|uniref:hypothetical protein n=1 Tax=Sphingomonas bacterium TaxID=1895847 RepID=UPI00261F2DEB|nr:hypothetical protein [Sphingomonas bacterium]MDB5707778.1 hypothetical protein [Sphingomonas bacterium]